MVFLIWNSLLTYGTGIIVRCGHIVPSCKSKISSPVCEIHRKRGFVMQEILELLKKVFTIHFCPFSFPIFFSPRIKPARIHFTRKYKMVRTLQLIIFRFVVQLGVDSQDSLVPVNCLILETRDNVIQIKRTAQIYLVPQLFQ